jgi:hypothetical protein
VAAGGRAEIDACGVLVRAHQRAWAERLFRQRRASGMIDGMPLTPLGRRLLEELSAIAASGGGVTVSIAAAQWVGAYNIDVVQRALVVAVEEGAGADVIDLLAGVAGSLRTVRVQPVGPVAG